MKKKDIIKLALTGLTLGVTLSGCNSNSGEGGKGNCNGQSNCNGKKGSEKPSCNGQSGCEGKQK